MTIVQVVQQRADTIMGRKLSALARRTRYGGIAPKSRRIAASVLRLRRTMRRQTAAASSGGGKAGHSGNG